jgi:hypothetical protein
LKEDENMVDEVDYRYIVHYKTYPRFERIELNHRIDSPLSNILGNRRTRRDPRINIDANMLHAIIHQSGGRTGQGEAQDLRAYPSAGARYPLEIYVLINDLNGLSDGIYHYSPYDGSLEVLWEGPTMPIIRESKLLGEQEFLNKAKAVILISAIQNRIQIWSRWRNISVY